jgi:hypothetical protein
MTVFDDAFEELFAQPNFTADFFSSLQVSDSFTLVRTADLRLDRQGMSNEYPGRLNL